VDEPKKPGVDSQGTESAPVVYHPSRGKGALVLVLALGFVALGGFLLSRPDATAVMVGWLGIAFGLVGAAAAAIQLVPGSTCLVLEPSGLTQRHAWREHHVPWSQVRAVGVGTISGNRMVLYDVTEEHPAASSAQARASRALTGYSHGLPDSFGPSPDELAEELERWWAAHAP